MRTRAPGPPPGVGTGRYAKRDAGGVLRMVLASVTDELAVVVAVALPRAPPSGSNGAAAVASEPYRTAERLANLASLFHR